MSPQTILFCADADQNIGTGHVMRLLPLIEESLIRGYQCYFLGNTSEIPWLDRSLENFSLVRVKNNPSSNYLDPSKTVLVVDSYSPSRRQEFFGGEKWKAIVGVIDKEVSDFSADIKIVPSLQGFVQNPQDSNVLTGPKYALIRKSIVKSSHVKDSAKPLHVLVVGGGVDKYGLCEAMVSVLEELKCTIKVSFLSNNSIITSSRNEYRFISPGSILDEIVNSVDVAICTASGSAVEFIAREIPLGVVCAAPNQKHLYMEMTNLGLASPLGSYLTETGWDIDKAYVEDLIFHLDTRAGLQRQQREFIDLKGPTRILDVIELLHN